MIIVDQTNSGQTVDLPVGQVMELRLAENPTTGYRWSFTADGTPTCAVLNDRFDRPGGPPGQGGQHTWQIKGVAVGNCDISMQYRRSFAPDAVAGSFNLHVRVTK